MNVTLLRPTMGKVLVVFALLAGLSVAKAGLLLWSPIQLHLPALKVMQQENFDDLLKELDNPNVVAFRADSATIRDVIPRKLDDFHSSYVPSTNIKFKNVKNLDNDLKTNTKVIEENINDYHVDNTYKHILLVVIINNDRMKREDKPDNITQLENASKIMENGINAEDNIPKVEENIPKAKENVPKTDENETVDKVVEYKGPVVYSSQGTAMIYSSKAPLLRINSQSFALGPAKLVTKDSRDGYTRLSANIAVGGGKVILLFKFPSSRGYWYLTSVEVVDQRKHDSKSYNLSITGEITAPARFSYHCHKDTIFRDPTGNIELTLYQIQAQPDSANSRFSDAYNCVSFMTGAIWSGIMVSASLIFGFLIALAALSNIKTMDKFDNYKTKQLSITVSE